MGPCIGFYDTDTEAKRVVKGPNFDRQLSRDQGRVLFASGKENVNRAHELKVEEQRNNLRKKSHGAYIPRCSRYGSEIRTHA